MSSLIEPMSIDDYDEVSRLWQSAEGVGLSESDRREGVASCLQRNPGLSLVARDGATIIGAVLCGHDGRRGYLHHLAVAKRYRQKGVGTLLVESALARLKEIGIPKCNIFVFADNGSGERFWTRRGWTKRADLQVLQKALT